QTKVTLAVTPVPSPGSKVVTVWQKPNANAVSLSRNVGPRGHTRFLIRKTQFDAESGKDMVVVPHVVPAQPAPLPCRMDEEPAVQIVAMGDSPARSRTGQLRLVRNGTVLSYLVADGDSGEFVCISQEAFSNGDLKNVRVGGTTGSLNLSLDARVTS